MIKDAFTQLCTAQSMAQGLNPAAFLSSGSYGGVNARDFGNSDLYAHIAVTTTFTVLAAITTFRIDIVMDDGGVNALPLGSILFTPTPAAGTTPNALLVAGAHFFVPLAPTLEGLSPVAQPTALAGVRADGPVYANIRAVFTYTGTVTTGNLSIDLGLKPAIIGRNYPVGTTTYAP